jgi:hypothetical protein
MPAEKEHRACDCNMAEQDETDPVASWECSDADTTYIVKQLRSWTTRRLQQLQSEARTPSSREAIERIWTKWQSRRKGKKPLGVVARLCARILPHEEWVPRIQKLFQQRGLKCPAEMPPIAKDYGSSSSEGERSGKPLYHKPPRRPCLQAPRLISHR